MIAPRLFYAYVSYSFVLRISLYLCRSTSTKTIERLEICVLLTKLSQNHFNTFKFKIRSVCNFTIPVSEWYPMVVHECQILFNFFFNFDFIYSFNIFPRSIFYSLFSFYYFVYHYFSCLQEKPNYLLDFKTRTPV